MTISAEAIEKLYAEESVSDYVPEEVSIALSDDRRVTALCYNLPEHLMEGTNASYAQSLHALAKREGLPSDYLALIEQMT